MIPGRWEGTRGVSTENTLLVVAQITVRYLPTAAVVRFVRSHVNGTMQMTLTSIKSGNGLGRIGRFVCLLTGKGLLDTSPCRRH
jgi:hypothetical protein